MKNASACLSDPILQLSDREREVLGWFYNWRKVGGDNFASLVFELMCKADPGNKARLERGFPEESKIFNLWRIAPSEADFFRAFGFDWNCGG